jgi:alkylation response protein AidB-like acyl-CoA dehydrogenase
MVTFEITDEQRMIQETARDFAARELAPRAKERDQKRIFPTAELRKLAGLGLLGVNVPEEHGGAAAGAVAYALAITELARGCAATVVPVAVTNMVAEVICRFGTEAQKERHVRRITSGGYECAAFALSEPHCGSDAAALRTVAKPVPGGFLLTGTKQWISHGDRAGVIVVWARTSDAPGAKGVSALLVEAGAKGMEVGKHEEKMGIRGSSTVPLVFEDCFVPEDALLGKPGGGFAIAMTALDGGRIGIGSQSVGIGQAALEEGVRYAKERKAFGAPLAQLEAIQFMLADCAMELDAARLLVLRAAHLKEKGRPYSSEASMAKVYASEAVNRICFRVLQIHGGYGYTTDYTIERLTRDARVTTIYEGTSEIQRIVIGRALTRE